MNSYLHFICGNYQLLLIADCIVEVGESAGARLDKNPDTKVVAKTASALHRVWRDRNLPVVDLGQFLQLDLAKPRYQLVTYDSAVKNTSSLTILDVDEIVGLMDLEESDFVDFAEINQQVGQFFDKAYIHSVTDVCLLRVSYPFHWLSSK
ncbi:MAG TPA: hypothetical protein VIM85_12520 [Pseudomonadales bacterium]